MKYLILFPIACVGITYLVTSVLLSELIEILEDDSDV